MEAVMSGGSPLTGNNANELFRWQDQAVQAWLAAGGRGIVEGMTGTGKTHVAVKAIKQLLANGVRIPRQVHRV